MVDDVDSIYQMLTRQLDDGLRARFDAMANKQLSLGLDADALAMPGLLEQELNAALAGTAHGEEPPNDQTLPAAMALLRRRKRAKSKRPSHEGGAAGGLW